MKKNKRGITLIALIITVIVLLILAGTAVSIAINSGDVFGKASSAREQWNVAVENEQDKINEVLQILNSIPEPLPAGWSTTSVARVYPSIDAVQKAPIPKEFVASEATGENNIATGLVIYKGTEEVTDANVATAQTTRDQYVWIPVDNSSTITWSNEADDTRKLTSTDTSKVDLAKEDTLTLTTDFNAMKTSVQTYGGFYISRYELGGTVSTPISRKGQTALDSGISELKAWYGLYNAAHQNITDGANIVLSGHMIFGSEYEKVLSFIDSNNTDYSITRHANKQQTVKHASGIIEDGQTGKELDIVNNIVDLEGNLFEWTTEANGTYFRIIRGGDYVDALYNNRFYPVSSSNDGMPTAATGYYGVRQALYVML